MPWKISKTFLGFLPLLTLPSGGLAERPAQELIVLSGTEPDAQNPVGGETEPADLLSDTPVKLGRTYKVRGVAYTPVDDRNYETVGYASWYGNEFKGRRTASGEKFDPASITAAHTTLPMPSYVEITSLDTGRTILARVNDRGPFTEDRVLDMSRGAAKQLGISGHGHAAVRVRRVEPSDEDRALLRAGKPVPLRAEISAPELNTLRTKISYVPEAKHDIASLPANARSYIVQLAAFSSENRANGAAERSGASLSRRGPIWRVRYGPYGSLEEAKKGIELAAAAGFNGAHIMVNE